MGTQVQTGERYGKLTVIEPVGFSSQQHVQHWLCRCDCGGTSTPTEFALRHGLSSCGCLRGRQKTVDPEPDEIAAICEDIRSEWDEREYYVRAGKLVPSWLAISNDWTAGKVHRYVRERVAVSR